LRAETIGELAWSQLAIMALCIMTDRQHSRPGSRRVDEPQSRGNARLLERDGLVERRPPPATDDKSLSHLQDEGVERTESRQIAQREWLWLRWQARPGGTEILIGKPLIRRLGDS